MSMANIVNNSSDSTQDINNRNTGHRDKRAILNTSSLYQLASKRT